MISGVHHIAVICSDYECSKRFYCEVLGLPIVSEAFRAERSSWKLNVRMPDGCELELFTFPGAPGRPSYPEACGLRHLAFRTEDLDAAVRMLRERGVPCEPVRIDAQTNRRFTFFADPDGLPLELYEMPRDGRLTPA